MQFTTLDYIPTVKPQPMQNLGYLLSSLDVRRSNKQAGTNAI